MAAPFKLDPTAFRISEEEILADLAYPAPPAGPRRRSPAPSRAPRRPRRRR